MAENVNKSPKPQLPAPRYSRSFAILHWLTAALLLVVYVGTEARAASTVMTYDAIQAVHQVSGIIFLLLLIVRVAWLPWSGAPGPAGFPGFMDRLTYGTHGLLYVLMLAAPVTGIALVLARAEGVNLFGLVVVPALLSEPSRWFLPLAQRLHELSAHGLIAVAVIHLLAALYHHFVLRDRLISRIWPL